MTNPHYAASLALADLQRALGDVEGVQFLLSRLSERHPNDADVAERMLRFAWDTGSNELAARALTHLGRLPRQAAHALALMAGRIEQRDGPEAALQYLAKFERDTSAPAWLELLETRVDLLLALERGQEALAEVEAALAKKPESARLLVLRASVHRAQGDPTAAAADLRAARAADETHLPALLELAALEAESGRPEAARKLYTEALPLEAAQATMEEPGDSAAAIALARLDLEAGAVEAARSRLHDVLGHDPRNGEAAWMLLQSYPDPQELGEAERADLARRAAVFGRIPEAGEALNRLEAAKS